MSEKQRIDVFDRSGNQVGARVGDKVEMSDGSNWKIDSGNVYSEDDNFVGQVRDDSICSLTGEVLYSFGTPYLDVED